jgi:hypothetical protein
MQMFVICSTGVAARVIWEGHLLQIREILLPVIVSISLFAVTKGKLGVVSIGDEYAAYGYAGLSGAFGKDVVNAMEKWVRKGGILTLFLRLLPPQNNNSKEEEETK